MILRVAAFCFSPKDTEMVDVIACFTGDGYGLARHALERWRVYASSRINKRPVLFIAGVDNLMCEAESLRIASATDFKNWLIAEGVPEDQIFVDDFSCNTLEQAQNLVRYAQEYGWRRILLLASGYHILRAWLTVVKTLRKERENLVIVPEPSYTLSFFGQNPELKDQSSTWDLFKTYTLPRIPKYQKKGDVASWQEADAYLKECGF